MCGSDLDFTCTYKKMIRIIILLNFVKKIYVYLWKIILRFYNFLWALRRNSRVYNWYNCLHRRCTVCNLHLQYGLPHSHKHQIPNDFHVLFSFSLFFFQQKICLIVYLISCPEKWTSKFPGNPGNSFMIIFMYFFISTINLTFWYKMYFPSYFPDTSLLYEEPALLSE